VETVVEHRGGDESSGAGGAVVAVKEGGGEAGGGFVAKAGGDGDRIARGWDGGSVGRVEDEGRDVGGVDGVDDAGSAVDRNAGGPVLPVLVGKAGVDEFERFAEAVVVGIPFPAARPALGQAAAASAPIALVGVGDGVFGFARGVIEADFFAAVAQRASPVAEGGDAGVFGLEGREMGGDDKVGAGSDGGVTCRDDCRSRAATTSSIVLPAISTPCSNASKRSCTD
jgi:hypothetical protein